MQLGELFSPGDVVVGFEPADKWQAIRDLVDHLVDTGRIGPAYRESVLEAVLDRERSMSTGMENGVAIPHAAVDDLESVVACMGIVSRSDGLVFDSIDGAPARFVVLLVIPRAQKLLHIRTLADVARVLAQDEVREDLIESGSREEAIAVLTRGER
ncbi:MAG: PTS sugar transporter subunit IIA [bacterium]|nr:PTS sugar transporter subunit IIA [bacterium]